MAQYYFSPTISVLIILALVSLSSGRRSVNAGDEHLARTGFRVSLTHIDAGQNLTKLQLIQRGISRGKHRLEKLNLLAKFAQSVNDARAPIFAGDGEFLLSLSIGTPPVPFPAIMDTGSDLIWTQCEPCTSCFNQKTPIFDPARSSSFSKVPCTNELCRSKALGKSRCGVGNSCDYLNTYADDSSTQGFLAMDKFTFGESASVPNIGFGCGVSNQGMGLNQSSGLVGLGRGSMSLISQLHTQKFSYCFSSIGTKSTSGSLFVGSSADLNVSKGAVIKTTPLIKNSFMPSFYYISLQGITVGQTLLPIPVSLFELGSDGSGGFILDSGTTYTMLQEDAFDALTRVFVAQTKLPVSNLETSGFSLCFKLPASKSNATGIKFPSVVFHFKGGLDLNLPTENYMVTDKASGLACLAMGPTGSLSIFGNVQQQNILVLHDLQKQTLSFIPTRCDQH